MSSTPKFAHIVLQTNRLQEMKDWYCTLLGAHVVFENPAMCFITFDEEHHRIAIGSLPGVTLDERTPMTVGLQHSAYTYPTLKALLDHYEHLKGLGLEPHAPVQHGVTTSLYYRDPDGNLAELTVDNFVDPEDSTHYMQTALEYIEDPIGPAFDPQLMADELRAGGDPRELATRAWALSGPALPHPAAALLGQSHG